MKKRTQHTPPNGTPAPIMSSADALAAAQSHLNELTYQFAKDRSLTPEDRAVLVEDIKTAKAHLIALREGQQ